MKARLHEAHWLVQGWRCDQCRGGPVYDALPTDNNLVWLDLHDIPREALAKYKSLTCDGEYVRVWT